MTVNELIKAKQYLDKAIKIIEKYSELHVETQIIKETEKAKEICDICGCAVIKPVIDNNTRFCVYCWHDTN